MYNLAMNCCHLQGLESLFDEQNAKRELADYRAKGPAKTTRWMIDALKAEGVQGATLLDIGGGVGAVQHGLLEAGAQSATDVDASRAYIGAAREEARRRGLAERTRFEHANFVEAAGRIEPADVVTLDRVICCFPDMHQLVDLSAARAKRLYAVVYPRDAWWNRLGIAIMNLIFRLQKNPFRTFVHPTRAVEEIIRKHGLRKKFYRQSLIWQVVVYGRG